MHVDHIVFKDIFIGIGDINQVLCDGFSVKPNGTHSRLNEVAMLHSLGAGVVGMLVGTDDAGAPAVAALRYNEHGVLSKDETRPIASVLSD